MDKTTVGEIRDMLELIKECVSEIEKRLNSAVANKNEVVVILGDGSQIRGAEVVHVDKSDVDDVANLESQVRQGTVAVQQSNQTNANIAFTRARSRAGWTPERREQVSRRMRKWWKEQKRAEQTQSGLKQSRH